MRDLWMPDAAKIASQEGFLDVVLRKDNIPHYLDTVGEGDNLFFLIGPKGSGKTHLLLCKSYQYHHSEKGKGYRFNVDSRQLVEYAEFQRNTLSEEDLEKFRNPELWKSIWALCLLIIAFKSAEIQLDSKINRRIESLLGESTRISAMLTNVFKNRKKVSELINLSGELSAQAHLIKSGVAIFIDNVDQAFEDIILEARERYGTKTQSIEAAVETWVNAQMGLLDAVYTLCTQHDHLKIFVTIRLEAFRLRRPRDENYLHHGIKLLYDKDDIERIINARLQIINQKKNLAEFLGFSTVPHAYVTNSDGSAFEEEIFDFIYRHTYGRPREITAIGQKIQNLVTGNNYDMWPDAKKQDKVRDIVNEEARDFFNHYKQQVIPVFNEIVFENFLNALKRNVFPDYELIDFEKDTLDFYYTLGLIGHTQSRLGRLIQKFRNFSQYEFGKIQRLPPAEFYFIHPTLNRTLIEFKNDYSVLDNSHLIGPDLPFNSPTRRDSSEAEERIKYYFPAKVIGARWDKPYQKQAEPLKEYYDIYFRRRPEVLVSILKVLSEDFQKKFTLIAEGDLVFALNKQFQQQYEQHQRQKSKEIRLAFPKKNVYQATLPKKDRVDSARSLFGERLFGRLITLGACFFTNLSLCEIHDLLTTDNDLIFNGKPHPNQGNNIKYLQTAFFIEGISDFRQFGRDPEVLFAIYAQLSPFEKNLLSQWRIAIDNHFSQLNWVFPEHREWVSEHWLNGIWRP